MESALEWGPSNWPFYWCDLPTVSEVDCGVYANVAEIALEALGGNYARLQVVELASQIEVNKWRNDWMTQQADPGWILAPDTVYHEMVAIRLGSEVAVFDPTECQFVRSPAGGRNPIVAVRLSSGASIGFLDWCGYLISSREWLVF